MEKKDRKKLCAQCEGNIPYNMKHCPFCGFEQQEKISTDFFEENNQKNSDLSSLYNPPYLSKSIGEARREITQESINNFSSTSEEREDLQNLENTLAKKELIVIILLSVGGQFMMLGLMLLLFSVDGVVTLQWKSKYWYFYCIFSMPFLLLGLKSLKKFKPYN